MGNTAFIWFWSAMIFLSIAWYGFLVFYVGYKGGREIIQMARALSANHSANRPPSQSGPRAA